MSDERALAVACSTIPARERRGVATALARELVRVAGRGAWERRADGTIHRRELPLGA